MGYVNKFNRGIARVQKELLDNGNGIAQFNVDMITVFSVGVTNAKGNNVSDNVSEEYWKYYDFESLNLSDKSLKIIELCSTVPMCKKDLMKAIGVTNQSNNVRAIVGPLLTEELIWPCAEDANRVRGVRYVLTAKGKAFLTYIQSMHLF